MTYGIGYSDLFEPGFSFSTLNQWVHVAVVTNENGVDGEVRDGIPVMTKIYVNGQLMLSERGRDDRLPYTPNDKEVAMVAFTGLAQLPTVSEKRAPMDVCVICISGNRRRHRPKYNI